MLHFVQGSKRNGRLLRSVFPCAAKGGFPSRSESSARSLSPKGRRIQGERGASIVEFAMVLPLFVGLLMGFIDFGLNLNNISSVRQAVREGARDMAVGDAGDAVCTLSATATPVPPLTKNLLCGIKQSVPGSNVRVRLVFPDPAGYVVGKKGLVCAQYQVASATGFYQSLLKNTVTKVQTQMRIEKILTGLVPYSEDAFVGQDWTWCK